MWIDIGEDDPFRTAVEQVAHRLEKGDADVKLRIWPGDHNESYWWSHMDDYISFYATALKQCDHR